MTWITKCLRVALATVVAGGALAAPPPGEPLDPEKAFPVSARVTSEGVDLEFRIAEGYYLYSNRFRVEAKAGPPLGPARPPRGETRDDPFVGRTQILRSAATVRVPFARPPEAGTYRIEVTAQGCAEDRVCYAPFTQVLSVRIPPPR